MALTTQPPNASSPRTPPKKGRLTDPHALAFYQIPEPLRGLRALLVTDTHVRRMRPRFDTLLDEVRDLDHDLLVLGGDYMDKPGDEPVAHEMMNQLVRTASPTHGAVGVWGNHDSPDLRRRLRHLPVRWLENDAWALDDLPLTIYGLDVTYVDMTVQRGDMLRAILDEPDATATRQGADAPAPPRFRLLISHMPNWLPVAADLGVDLMLSGHTHGGQVRLPLTGPLINCLPGWPLSWSSGVLRCGQTRGVVSRGVGENSVQGLRFFCPAHAPLITLENADTQTEPCETVRCEQRW